MSILVVNTKTTGKTDPIITEVSYVEINYPSLTIAESFNQRYNPGKAIELGATAVTHILNEDLIDCPPASSFIFPKEADYIISHKIDYDWRVLGEPNVKRIDTLTLSRHLLPDLDSHTQSALLYYYEGAEAREKLRHSHSAYWDIVDCLTVFSYLLAEYRKHGQDLTDIEEVYQLSEKARIPTCMPFGKHKGEKLEDVPRDYITWLLNQPDVDPYLEKALRAVL